MGLIRAGALGRGSRVVTLHSQACTVENSQYYDGMHPLAIPNSSNFTLLSLLYKEGGLKERDDLRKLQQRAIHTV